ncbi:MAG TPA: 4Fe-4S dicluster domain-containing protein, partial [Desulfobacterales bacterium]|nr:4Fe-4S dicluster domain-containing protein [Desulfobacterales bacterium]
MKVIAERCTGCKLCIKACPFGAIELVNKKAVIDLQKCTLCGACIEPCKLGAIVLTKISPSEIEFQKKIEEHRDVWVFCEQKNGVVQSVAYELLGRGRELADVLGVDLCGVLLGESMKEEAQKIIYRG